MADYYLDFLAKKLGMTVSDVPPTAVGPSRKRQTSREKKLKVEPQPGLTHAQRRELRLAEDIERNWEKPAPATEPPNGWLGVDVGFIYPAVDSEGRIYRWAQSKERRNAKWTTTEAGPVTVKKANGDTYTVGPYTPSEMADVTARAETNSEEMRTHIIARQVIKAARESGKGIALEDWSDFKKEKRPAWIRIYKHIIAQARKQHVPLRTVQRAYSSQICPECGYLSRSNRPSRNRFKCVDCGFEGQADHVAARNLENRAPDGKHVVDAYQCKNPACENAPWRKGLCCSCYFYKRRYQLLPTPERMERLKTARNYREFNRKLEQVGRPKRAGDES